MKKAKEIKRIIEKQVNDSGGIKYLVEFDDGTEEWKDIMSFEDSHELVEEYEIRSLGVKQGDNAGTKRRRKSLALDENITEPDNAKRRKSVTKSYYESSETEVEDQVAQVYENEIEEEYKYDEIKLSEIELEKRKKLLDSIQFDFEGAVNKGTCKKCSFNAATDKDDFCYKCIKDCHCFQCNSNTPNNAEKLFRCFTCERSFHVSCLSVEKFKEGVIEMLNLKSRLLKTIYESSVTIYHFMSLKNKPNVCFDCNLCDHMPEKVLDSFKASENGEVEYLVKLKEESFLDIKFVSSSWLNAVSRGLLRSFLKNNVIPSSSSKFDLLIKYKQFMEIDRVLYVSFVNGRLKCLVKWRGLQYDECTDEFVDDFDIFGSKLREKLSLLKDSNLLDSKKVQRIEHSSHDFEEVFVPPKELKGGKLIDYQLEGLNWLLFKYYSGVSCVLADEMGLGKTIQTISFLVALHSRHGYFPFLLIVPNATLGNWEKELMKWAPHLVCTSYYGSAESRRIIKDFDLYSGSDTRYIKSHVVLTTYDMILREANTLAGIKWEAIVVDEGHRLKDRHSKLYKTLMKQFVKEARFTLLLTGTPLQNTVTECLNLMQFLDDKVFTNKLIKELEEKFKVLTKENVLQLHKLVRPYILRRTKSEVLREKIPDKVEIVIPVQMSKEQKELYKMILSKNYQLLKKVNQNMSLNNILVQLRKLLNHPFLINLEGDTSRLVSSCGKLQILERILKKLKEQGRRVLMFSNMTSSLDILEDFCELKEYKYLRMDGSYNAQAKTKAVDEFNDNSDYFIFLISTRAGGLGINLTSADTIIFYETDYNPHLDIQALSRAHRIGQQKKVFVYRLITKSTVEEKIMERAKVKLLLDSLVIKKLDVDSVDLNPDEIDGILRAGVDKLFDDEEGETLDDEALDKLLDIENEGEIKDERRDSISNIFSVAKVWKVDERKNSVDGSDNIVSVSNETSATISAFDSVEDLASVEAIDDQNDPNFWEKFIGTRITIEEKEAVHEEEIYGVGRRTRSKKPVNYFAEQDEVSSSKKKVQEKEYVVSETDSLDSEEFSGSDEDYSTVLAENKKANITSFSSNEVINGLAKEESKKAPVKKSKKQNLKFFTYVSNGSALASVATNAGHQAQRNGLFQNPNLYNSNNNSQLFMDPTQIGLPKTFSEPISSNSCAFCKSVYHKSKECPFIQATKSNANNANVVSTLPPIVDPKGLGFLSQAAASFASSGNNSVSLNANMAKLNIPSSSGNNVNRNDPANGYKNHPVINGTAPSQYMNGNSNGINVLSAAASSFPSQNNNIQYSNYNKNYERMNAFRPNPPLSSTTRPGRPIVMNGGSRAQNQLNYPPAAIPVSKLPPVVSLPNHNLQMQSFSYGKNLQNNATQSRIPPVKPVLLPPLNLSQHQQKQQSQVPNNFNPSSYPSQIIQCAKCGSRFISSNTNAGNMYCVNCKTFNK